MKIIYIFIVSIIFTACIKEETPVAAVERAYTETIALGENYAVQVYYDLENKKIAAYNDFEIWDLAINSNTDMNTIVLNTAKNMRIFPLPGKTFDEVSLSDFKAVNEEDWLYDAPSGNQDTTAFGVWWQIIDNQIVPKDITYLLDRGKDSKGDKIGSYKLKIVSADKESISFRFQNLRADEIIDITVIKDSKTNFSMLSIDSKEQISIEPNKEDWDILFTKHTELLFTSEGDAMWYGVTSILLNPYNCTAAFNTDSTYNLITLDSIPNYTFSSDRNTIGHDWKYYDLDAGVYLMRYRNTYLIKSRNDYYFKLRFTSFTNASGEKGYPEFEFEGL